MSGLDPHGSTLASASVRSSIFPKWSTPRASSGTTSSDGSSGSGSGSGSNAERPSLYHDVDAATPPKPLFTRRVEGLPSPNVLHYVPISLDPSEQHLKLLTKWHQDPRVAEWWQQALTEEKQAEYIRDIQTRDDHLGLIGYWSDSEDYLGEPWGCVEVYWAGESNLTPFYNFPTHALGFHALVGESQFRGPDRVRAWMGSAVYLLFALEPRCTLVVSEPNIKNQKMVDYECECGGRVEKPIDLPHKTAALVFFEKEHFVTVWPLLPRDHKA